MVEKRLGKQQMNRGWIFLLIFLVAIGIFFLYRQLSYTGYVVNVNNGNLTSYPFSNGVFVNNTTIIGSDNNSVVLRTNLTQGTYLSQILAIPNGTQVNLVYTIDTPNSTAVNFSTTSCFDSNCTNATFVNFTPSLNITSNITIHGTYFQFKADLQTNMSGVSPVLKEVNISYSTAPAYYITIQSPQNITYNNESVTINLLSNLPNIFFSVVNGTSNQNYTGQISKTFAEGGHVINAWASDINNNTVSSSVAFSVLFVNNLCNHDSSCNNAETCATCPSDCGACVVVNNTASNSSPQQETTVTQPIQPLCTPNWQCDQAWSACVNGAQTRACADLNNCGTVKGMPATSQVCTVPVTPNQTVVNTAPAKTGFFSIMGNVITAPVKTVGGTIVSILVLLLIVGGFFAYKFRKKLKLKIPFFKFKKGSMEAY